MLPSASLAALDTWPSVHPFGMCGQDGSTTNFGTSTVLAGRGGAAAVRRDPAISNATTAAKMITALRHNNLWRAALARSRSASGLRARFRFTSILNLLFGFYADLADSNGSTSAQGVSGSDHGLVHRTILLPRTQ